jgi:methylmalonyl-CoA/ethylmalonyl-CoA epimerase
MQSITVAWPCATAAFNRAGKGATDPANEVPFMIGKLNHVGIATPSIEESWKLYRDVLGATSITDKRALPEQGVWVSFVNLPNAQIELIEPYGDASPIHGFLAKNPKGGQHRVCFEVPDIIAARDEMRAKGATVLGTGEPRIGAHGVPVIFVHPKDMGGVLVELMAEPQGAHA